MKMNEHGMGQKESNLDCHRKKGRSG